MRPCESIPRLEVVSRGFPYLKRSHVCLSPGSIRGILLPYIHAACGCASTPRGPPWFHCCPSPAVLGVTNVTRDNFPISRTVDLNCLPSLTQFRNLNFHEHLGGDASLLTQQTLGFRWAVCFVSCFSSWFPPTLNSPVSTTFKIRSNSLLFLQERPFQ